MGIRGWALLAGMMAACLLAAAAPARAERGLALSAAQHRGDERLRHLVAVWNNQIVVLDDGRASDGPGKVIAWMSYVFRRPVVGPDGQEIAIISMKVRVDCRSRAVTVLAFSSVDELSLEVGPSLDDVVEGTPDDIVIPAVASPLRKAVCRNIYPPQAGLGRASLTAVRDMFFGEGGALTDDPPLHRPPSHHQSPPPRPPPPPPPQSLPLSGAPFRVVIDGSSQGYLVQEGYGRDGDIVTASILFLLRQPAAAEGKPYLGALITADFNCARARYRELSIRMIASDFTGEGEEEPRGWADVAGDAEYQKVYDAVCGNIYPPAAALTGGDVAAIHHAFFGAHAAPPAGPASPADPAVRRQIVGTGARTVMVVSEPITRDGAVASAGVLVVMRKPAPDRIGRMTGGYEDVFDIDCPASRYRIRGVIALGPDMAPFARDSVIADTPWRDIPPASAVAQVQAALCDARRGEDLGLTTRAEAHRAIADGHLPD